MTKQAHEYDPVIIQGDLTESLTPEGFPHKQHAWLFATVLPHQRKHIITNQMVTMASVLMTCICGAQRHSWMAPPPDLQEDAKPQAVAAGLSLAGKPS